MEKYLVNELSRYGYEYSDGNINGVSSLSILAADLMKILSERISKEYYEKHEYENKLDLQLHEAVILTDVEKLMFPFTINEPFTFVIPDNVIRRKSISDQLFPVNKYPVLSNTVEYITLLNDMFKLYDYLFFSNIISYGLGKRTSGLIKFEFSDRLTSTGGTCRRDGICSYTIKISSDRLNKLLPENIGNIQVNGITPIDKINALQLIFEHELVHAILSLFKNDLSGHNNLYKTIVKNLFGHTKTTHGITDKKLSPTKQLNRYTKYDFNMDDNVYFINKQNVKIIGKIIKINPKRAKVNTSTGVFTVPYSMLKFL